MRRGSRAIHPGEILVAEFIRPLALSEVTLAGALGIPARRLELIVQGKRPISAEMDLRLSRYFGLPEGFFLRLQVEFDLDAAKDRLGARLEFEVTPLAA